MNHTHLATPLEHQCQLRQLANVTRLLFRIDRLQLSFRARLMDLRNESVAELSELSEILALRSESPRTAISQFRLLVCTETVSIARTAKSKAELFNSVLRHHNEQKFSASDYFQYVRLFALAPYVTYMSLFSFPKALGLCVEVLQSDVRLPMAAKRQ